MKRREFLRNTSGFVLGCLFGTCSPGNSKKSIQLGCFNRPWNKFSLEQTLDGIKAAGFGGLGLFPRSKHISIRPETAEKDCQFAEEQLGSRSLKLLSYTPRIDLRKSPKEIIEEHIPIMKALQRLGCSFILEMGTNKKEFYSKYYETMKYYSDAAGQYNIQIVLKPHGGISTSGTLCAEAVQRIGSENFRICYDPTNIYYYDKYDPIEELKNVSEYVTAMCIKDYRSRSSEKPDIFITPGDGEVDFEEIFRILKKVNFKGPCIVECLGGTSLEEINQEAKRAFDYLSGLIW